jgi:deazaflavin-dependent oxidoreductase (nitroreductase family)
MSDTNEMKAFNEAIIDEFRANDGKVGGAFAGAPLLLLTTTGAKSGQQRTSPVVYSTDGDRLVIIASYAGAPKNPAWFNNLVANPEVTVEIPGETFAARAVVAGTADRERLYAAHAAMMPAFNEYQTKTTRVIPVVSLERINA